MDRRTFIQHSCALGATLPTLGTSLLSLASARTAAAQSASDYKALVCILLAGGNDSYNMLLPTDPDTYATYAAIRADLALPAQDLLPIAPLNANGRSFAVHPQMAALQSLFNNGDAAMVANVGTLLEPFDAAAVEAGRARLPVGLFSHADQISQWQTAVPDGRTSEGWAGRIADGLQAGNPANGIGMNISLSGSNVFQSGQSTDTYSISANGTGAIGINSYADGTGFGDYRKRVLDQILAMPQPHTLRGAFSRRLRESIENQQIFDAAMTQAQPFDTGFSAAPLSAALRQIARVISVRDVIGNPRQTFFVTIGGWDHHDEVLNNQARMLPQVANALAEFAQALKDINVFDQVTTFTISDFGRTMTSNGRGSDHGWGGHHIVVGGQVQGQHIFGDYPTLALANAPLDVGRGIYAPTTSIDAYFADLALWFGVAPSELDRVLPNVRTFYDPLSNTPALGLFG
ncbi:MAG: DUF1501 domain-containing protein [Pseudomonadota bacterium]